MTTSTDRFRSLHADGTFVMPNPYDLGSARLLAALGFPALASTSSGFAATLGRLDMMVGREELLDHVDALAAATDLPLNVDSERCYADDLAGVTETVELLAEAGAAGCSIEDWNPTTGSIDPMDVAAERVGAAAAGAAKTGLVLTARSRTTSTESRISTTPSPGSSPTLPPVPRSCTHPAWPISIRSPNSSRP